MANPPANKIISSMCSETGCSEPRRPASNGRGHHRQCAAHLVAHARATHKPKPRIPSWRHKIRILDLHSPISYSQAHKRLERWCGPASNQSCVDCDRDAEQWTLKADPSHLFTDGVCGRSKALRYSTDPRDYEPMCTACHARRRREAPSEGFEPPTIRVGHGGSIR